MSELHSHAWQRSENLIKNASPSAASMLLNGRAPFPGEIMRFPDLAETFKAVAKDGKKGFYTGRIAEAIVELIKSKGGVMELSDLAEHESTKVTPISYTYKVSTQRRLSHIASAYARYLHYALQNEVTVHEVSFASTSYRPVKYD